MIFRFSRDMHYHSILPTSHEVAELISPLTPHFTFRCRWLPRACPTRLDSVAWSPFHSWQRHTPRSKEASLCACWITRLCTCMRTQGRPGLLAGWFTHQYAIIFVRRSCCALLSWKWLYCVTVVPWTLKWRALGYRDNCVIVCLLLAAFPASFETELELAPWKQLSMYHHWLLFSLYEAMTLRWRSDIWHLGI